MSVRNLSVLLAIACLCCFAGCGKSGGPVPQDVAIESRLGEVAELYRIFQIQNKRPPKSMAEARAMENAVPSGLTPIVTGEVIVFWGATLPELGEEPSGPESDTVLAYEKDVPTMGGKVLMLDRRIGTMTAEAFATAPKAGTLEAAPPAKKK